MFTTMDSYVCSTCGKTFSLKHNLFRHQRMVHSKDKKVFICNECHVTCLSKSKFLNHWRSLHSTSGRKVRSIAKICPLCKCEEKNIMGHFTTVHNIRINEKTYVFDDLKDFHAWKEKIETESLSKYILSYTNREKYLVKKFSCNRSGVYQSQSKGIRQLKTAGYRKLNAFCPASMLVTISTKVHVKFIDCHVGHGREVCHFNISPSTKEIIANKLMNNVPKKCILEEIRNSCDGVRVSRDDLIGRKDLDNIAFKYNIPSTPEDIDKRKNDAINGSITITDLQREYASFVRFFKPQDTLNENHVFLKEEDFVLVLMNSAQCNLLKLFGGNIVCVDRTPGIAEDFYLFAIVVMDDYHQGFPCSFMISNRNDIDVLQLFYKVIQDTAGKITPKVFMSDVACEIYNAWQMVMGSVEMRLFSSWHVLKAWRENIKKIKNTEKQKIVSKNLQAILYEQDDDKFNILLDDVIRWFKNDQDCRDFGLYFTRNYEKTAKSWAYCYRRRAGVTTNMSLERLHRTLKYVNLKDENMNRLDKSIYSLLKFSQDKLFDRLITLHKGKVTTKLKTLRSSHRDYTSVLVTSEENNTFERFLATCDIDTYRVVLINDSCSCKLICNECNSCLHKYSCECLDNTIKFNMCKHIHAVCQYVNSRTTIVVPDQIPVSPNIDHEYQVVNAEADDENLFQVLTSPSVARTPVLKKLEVRKQELQSVLIFNDILKAVRDNPSLRADLVENLEILKQKYENRNHQDA